MCRPLPGLRAANARPQETEHRADPSGHLKRRAQSNGRRDAAAARHRLNPGMASRGRRCCRHCRTNCAARSTRSRAGPRSPKAVRCRRIGPGAFRVIKRNAASLAGLVDTLFDLSRNASGSLTLTLELVDLSQLAALVVESTYPVARLHQVSLRLSSARTPLLVKGDRIRLEQVVHNLVDNAIKFTPSGGRVTLRTFSHTAFAELAIRDTGTGMSRELLPVIFDPFRQGGSPVASADVGMGLGLALARELVRLHGGEIEARSAGENRGSTFIVKLPLAVRSETA